MHRHEPLRPGQSPVLDTRREERPKPPAKLSVADFVVEANRQLRADRAYVPGTQFIVCTTGRRSRRRPSWEGPETMRPLIQRIFQGMTARFQLDVPFRIDRV